MLFVYLVASAIFIATSFVLAAALNVVFDWLVDEDPTSEIYTDRIFSVFVIWFITGCYIFGAF